MSTVEQPTLTGVSPTELRPADGVSVRRRGVRFTVDGIAKPAGSKKVFLNRKTGKPIVTDDSGKGGKAWRKAVRVAAIQAMAGRVPMDCALRVSITVYRPRPKSHYGTGRNASILKASAPDYPTVAPDVLKLARAIEDSMTGSVYRDDALIVDEFLRKRYSDQPRVEIDVQPL